MTWKLAGGDDVVGAVYAEKEVDVVDDVVEVDDQEDEDKGDGCAVVSETSLVSADIDVED